MPSIGVHVGLYVILKFLSTRQLESRILKKITLYRGETLRVLAAVTIDWQDLFLLYLVTNNLNLDLRVKYAEDYLYPSVRESSFPNVQNSFIQPLAANPSFGSKKWDLKVKEWTRFNAPLYDIHNNFHLILGANLYGRQYIHKIERTRLYYTLTRLPELPFKTLHIVARHPLAQPATFNPLAPLDLWSWILNAECFLVLGFLLVLSRRILSEAKISLYYATDFWKDNSWSKTNSIFLLVWAISFFLINNAYQIDFRTGLISQKLENSINTWNDIDMFNIHLYTFFSNQLTPALVENSIIFKSLLHFDWHNYR